MLHDGGDLRAHMDSPTCLGRTSGWVDLHLVQHFKRPVGYIAATEHSVDFNSSCRELVPHRSVVAAVEEGLGLSP